MTVPPLAERQRPGLSETLTGPRDPRRCQSCGREHTDAVPLARWLEHDEWDRVPTKPVTVVLCVRCSGQLIEPNHRLYRELERGESFPGCMGICCDCRFRDGVACTSPIAQVNGGPGLEMGWEKAPIHAHIYCGRGRGRGRSGFRWMFSGPVTSCSGRQPFVETPA